MKKLLFLLMAVSAVFTGCIKTDGEYEEMQKIAPGVEIYNLAALQMNCSMQPANVGIRLAILLAEAKKHPEVTDLNELVVKIDSKDVNVKNVLLGSTATIEKLENGDYTITFVPTTGQTGTVYDGVMTVRTGGRDISETDNANSWSVTTGDKFTFKVPQSNGYGSIYMYVYHMTGGATLLRAYGDGSSYEILPQNINIEAEGTKFTSAWSGVSTSTGDYAGFGFLLTVPKEGLAYSDCRKKFFSMSGAGAGPSFTSLNGGVSAITFMYEVTKGKYLGGNIYDGTISCELRGAPQIDYPSSKYPANNVQVVYKLDEATDRYSATMYYNGYSRRVI